MKTAWIAEALKYLVSGAVGIFIWVQGIISVMGTMIYAKQPLSDDVLVMLPGVKIGKSNVMPLIQKGLTSIIGSGNILHLYHKSFEEFTLDLVSTRFT